MGFQGKKSESKNNALHQSCDMPDTGLSAPCTYNSLNNSEKQMFSLLQVVAAVK